MKKQKYNKPNFLKSQLSLTDLAVLVTAKFFRGVMGEGTIQQVVYEFTELPEFASLKNDAGFITIGDKKFSGELHKILKDSSTDLSVKKPSDEATGLFISDILRFELYDKVYKEEKPYYEVINDMEPRVFWLSPNGQAMGQLLFRGKLTPKQRKIFEWYYKDVSKEEF